MFRSYIIAGLIATCCCFSSVASASEILGVEEEQWQTDLQHIDEGYTFSEDFLSLVATSQSKLESKYSSEHFTAIGSKQDTFRQKQKKNSLLHRKSSKARSDFILDLNLDKNTYHRLIAYLPVLAEYYSEKHMAQILPYIAFCLNYDVRTSDINFYIQESIRRQSPPDILCSRLYSLGENKL